jgi:SAM-dependent methyltransferase
MQANTYTPTWFETFLHGYSPEATKAEVAFIARQIPLPLYPRVLDLCCGLGRHALLLAERGYEVTGIDRDAAIIQEARRRAGESVTFLQGDMRDLSSVPGTFDAVLNLWQSFGYFNEATNTQVLCQVYDKLTLGGRFILDIYHRGFFEAHQGERTFERDGHTITETKHIKGNRLTVTLDYGSGVPPDVFDWQLYTPEEITALAEGIGFRALVACSWYDESVPATPNEARMQLVLEKRPLEHNPESICHL